MLPAAGPLLRSLAAAGALGVLAAVAACQPVDSEVPSPGEAPAAATARDAPAQPDPLPSDLATLLEHLEPAAAEWQSGAVVAEIAVGLAGGSWEEATVTYLAPDADRMLVVQVDAGGTREQRPTLETLELEPVAAAGLAEVPALPAGVLEPAALVESARGALEDCATGAVRDVLYTTGAPAAWDGETWTEPPAWTATLAGAGGALVVDPVTAEVHPAGCLEGA